jgi:hypothetical protein
MHKIQETLLRTHFPYCLKKQENGGYIILNRHYKPIGFCSKIYMVYEDYPIEFKIKRLTASQIQKIAKNIVNEDVYLYDDGCVPTHTASTMKAYLKKLEVLMQIKINIKKEKV